MYILIRNFEILKTSFKIHFRLYWIMNLSEIFKPRSKKRVFHVSFNSFNNKMRNNRKNLYQWFFPLRHKFNSNLLKNGWQKSAAFTPLTQWSKNYRHCMYSMVKQNWPPAQKYAIKKKSTIFTQFLWHFGKMTNSWDGHFDKVP